MWRNSSFTGTCLLYSRFLFPSKKIRKTIRCSKLTKNTPFAFLLEYSLSNKLAFQSKSKTSGTDQIHQGCYKGPANALTAKLAPRDTTTVRCRRSQAGYVHATPDRKATGCICTALSQINAVYCCWDPRSFQIALQRVVLTAGNYYHSGILVHNKTRSAPTESIRHESVTATDTGKILVQTEPGRERREEVAKLTIWKPPQGHAISQYRSPVTEFLRHASNN